MNNTDYFKMRQIIKKLQTVADVLQLQVCDDSPDLGAEGLEGLGLIVEGITADLRELCEVPAD